MKNPWLSIIVLAGSIICSNSIAGEQERIEHYKGKMPHSLEEATALFSQYNTKLAGVLSSEKLTGRDLATIHELTYTLENALGKIQTDLQSLAVTLESLHKASETGNIAETETFGKTYLETSRKLVD